MVDLLLCLEHLFPPGSLLQLQPLEISLGIVKSGFGLVQLTVEVRVTQGGHCDRRVDVDGTVHRVVEVFRGKGPNRGNHACDTGRVAVEMKEGRETKGR